MKVILEKFKGFLLISLGLIVLALLVALALSSYRGARLYYAELKEFKGAVSRAAGGDYKERADFVATPAPEPVDYSMLDSFNFEALQRDQLESIQQKVMTQLGEIRLKENEDKPRKRG